MSHTYEINHNGQKYSVDISSADNGGLLVRVNSQSFRLRPTVTSDGVIVINDGVTEHRLRVLRRIGDRIQIELNGQQRELSWSRAVRTNTALSRPDNNSEPSSFTKVLGGVYPPMPGRITEVLVKVGDQVKQGDTVCILEAMKMFNELKAARSGTVKQVNVQPGSNVKTHDLLVLIE